MEAFWPFKRILNIMPSRTARWFAVALVVFLFAQPIPFLAFAQGAGDGSSCCQDKNAKDAKNAKNASCCRRSHAKPSGPGFSSRDCCGQCQAPVSESQPVAESLAHASSGAELVSAIALPLARLGWIPSIRHDVTLFERPPPIAR
jgi:hypothetical protein